jgi:large subunit ribosomal protein L25
VLLVDLDDGPRSVAILDSAWDGDGWRAHAVSTIVGGGVPALAIGLASDATALATAAGLEQRFLDFDGAHRIESLRDQWLAAYDFVLVNAVAGTGLASGVATIQLADAVVLCVAPDRDAQRDVAEIVDRIQRARQNFDYDRSPVTIVPVPTQRPPANDAEFLAEFCTSWLPSSASATDALLTLTLLDATAEQLRQVAATVADVLLDTASDEPVIHRRSIDSTAHHVEVARSEESVVSPGIAHTEALRTRAYGSGSTQTEVKITAEPRIDVGRAGARRIRRVGKIPAVLYGPSEAPKHIALPAREFSAAIRQGGINQIFNIILPDGTQRLALSKAIQRDPMRDTFEHVDMVIVRRGERITVDVPVHFVGDPAADAVVVTEHDRLAVTAEALHLPEHLEVLIAGFPIGSHVTAGDVKLPTGVTLATSTHHILAVIAAGPGEAHP